MSDSQAELFCHAAVLQISNVVISGSNPDRGMHASVVCRQSSAVTLFRILECV